AASNIFRMAYSLSARLKGLMRRANASRPALFRKLVAAYAAFSGNFRGPWELAREQSVSYSGTACCSFLMRFLHANRCPLRSKTLCKFRTLDLIPPHAGDTAMVITAAHVPAIVALIAGILILIMPRLLNFIVAIYL